MTAPFVAYLERNDNKPLDPDTFPGNLPFTRDLHLEFDSPVTFFVGENGSGKSTLLEALAVLAHLPIAGGGTNEYGFNHAFQEKSLLADSMRLAFIRHPKDRYFFRAETQAHFASLLEQRRDDPDFKTEAGKADPFRSYGGKTLHHRSHGEAFLAVMQNRFEHGLILMDEPESALSPQRQLTLLALMHDLVESGKTQIIAATHSPILLTYPGARIISFDEGKLAPVELEETNHYLITRDILNHPEMYWRHLRGEQKPASGDEPASEV